MPSPVSACMRRMAKQTPPWLGEGQHLQATMRPPGLSYTCHRTTRFQIQRIAELIDLVLDEEPIVDQAVTGIQPSLAARLRNPSQHYTHDALPTHESPSPQTSRPLSPERRYQMFPMVPSQQPSLKCYPMFIPPNRRSICLPDDERKQGDYYDKQWPSTCEHSDRMVSKRTYGQKPRARRSRHKWRKRRKQDGREIRNV